MNEPTLFQEKDPVLDFVCSVQGDLHSMTLRLKAKGKSPMTAKQKQDFIRQRAKQLVDEKTEDVIWGEFSPLQKADALVEYLTVECLNRPNKKG